MDKKLKEIKDYLINGGGAVEFHTLNNLCISTKNDKLYKVVLCERTSDNPFGVKDVPFNPTEQLVDRILNVINS
jgi:hypothetical protein